MGFKFRQLNEVFYLLYLQCKKLLIMQKYDSSIPIHQQAVKPMEMTISSRNLPLGCLWLIESALRTLVADIEAMVQLPMDDFCGYFGCDANEYSHRVKNLVVNAAECYDLLNTENGLYRVFGSNLAMPLYDMINQAILKSDDWIYKFKHKGREHNLSEYADIILSGLELQKQVSLTFSSN